jgi:hypothetical protein
LIETVSKSAGLSRGRRCSVCELRNRTLAASATGEHSLIADLQFGNFAPAVILLAVSYNFLGQNNEDLQMSNEQKIEN